MYHWLTKMFVLLRYRRFDSLLFRYRWHCYVHENYTTEHKYPQKNLPRKKYTDLFSLSKVRKQLHMSRLVDEHSLILYSRTSLLQVLSHCVPTYLHRTHTVTGLLLHRGGKILLTRIMWFLPTCCASCFLLKVCSNKAVFINDWLITFARWWMWENQGKRIWKNIQEAIWY